MNQQTEIPQPDKKAKVTTNGHGPNGHANGHTNGDAPTHLTSQGCIELEQNFSSHNYHPLPIVFASAKGARVQDQDGRSYIDCLSAYCAMNQVGLLLCMHGATFLLRALGSDTGVLSGPELQAADTLLSFPQGHCHPKIIKALVDQASVLTLSSRAFHSNLLGVYAKKITELLG